MSHLTILGAGIAGACAWRAASDLGHTATVVGNGQTPAAAAGLATLHGPRARDAATLYEAWGVRVTRGALVTGYRRQDPTPTVDGAWWAVDPDSALNVPEVRPVTAADLPYGPLLVCTADPAWGTITWGATWHHPDPGALASTGLRVHHYAPYKHLTAVAWPSGARLGSTSAATEEGARDAAPDLLALAGRLGWADPADPAWTLLVGVRVKTPEPLAWRQGNLTFGGFHRDGYTLAATLAHEAVVTALQGDNP